MSPRRMDISSLLRDPSPPRSDNVRSTDPLLSLLNRPHPSPPPRPILGFDALVHVASEERRRINAAASLPDDRERPPFHARDSAPKHHSFPHFHSFSPHRLVHDSHRSPSPDLRFPFAPGQPSSPSTRPHHSASPINTYPTLRRQHFDPPRSAPALPPDDSRSIPHLSFTSLHHTPPYLPSLHLHSPPRDISPHRHSPQHLRSQHHSSPIQPASGSTDPGVLSPRYSLGPRMAGGIEVLSHDPSSIRDPSRPDLPNYPSTARDVFAERLVSEPRTEYHCRESPSLSPLSSKTFSLDDKQLKVSPPRGDGQESAFPRERSWSRFPHLPSVDVATTDDGKGMGKELNFLSQPLHDHRPTRVWEDQPKAREISRRVSLPHMPVIVSGPLDSRAWSGPYESGHDERSAREVQVLGLSHAVQESVHSPLQSTCESPPPPRAPIPVAPHLSTPFQGSCINSPVLPPSAQSPVQSESKTYVSQPTACMPTSPSPDVDLNSGTESEVPPEHFDSLVVPETSVSLTSSDPIPLDSSSKTGPIPEVLDAGDVNMTTPLAHQPSPPLTRIMSPMDPGMSEMATHSPRANPSQSTSRSLSRQPLPTVPPTKDEESAPLEIVPISTPICSEPPCQPLEPEYSCKEELTASEQTMMDVDEELLSLVEDRPLLPVKMQIDSPSVAGNRASAEEGPSDAPTGSFTSQPVVKSLIADEQKDRASMPPPAARGKKGEETTSVAGTVTGSKKKKDGTSKITAKPKQPPKPRAKPVTKYKAKPTPADNSSKASTPKNPAINARSRSTSAIPPGPVDDIVPEPEAEEGDKEDDKLYCICKTRYDEDRTMIACDRCDEWFHIQCVSMPELEIDLVDQFICPPCIQKHPHLRTTWKIRCLFGLQHENPLSPEACHKPSRGAFSKYCSDECGVKYMRARIARWEASGGARNLLWENVKNATKREGVVVHVETSQASSRMMTVDGDNLGPKPLDSAAKQRAEREVARLNARLDEVVKEREFVKRELDMVMWREKVVDLASERAGKVDECGWDQRLCFGEDEWADFGEEVLESYEEERVKMDSGEGSMPLDVSSAVHGEWWCTGKRKCERHAGWQKLRAAEVSFDKETKEGILLKLTTREREIRKHIEDILFPQPTGTLQASTKRPHPEVQLNGSEKLVGRVLERGKKKT